MGVPSEKLESALWRLGQEAETIREIVDFGCPLTDDQCIELLAVARRLELMAERGLFHRPTRTEQEQATSETSVRAA